MYVSALRLIRYWYFCAGSIHYNTMKFQVILYKRDEICFKYVSSHHSPDAGQEIIKMFTVTVESPDGEPWLTSSFFCQNVLSLRQQCLVSVGSQVTCSMLLMLTLLMLMHLTPLQLWPCFIFQRTACLITRLETTGHLSPFPAFSGWNCSRSSWTFGQKLRTHLIRIFLQGKGLWKLSIFDIPLFTCTLF